MEKARKAVWCQGIVEIQMLKDFWNNKFPPTDSIIDLLFGKKSRLAHFFQEELDLSYADTCRFLATLFTAAEMNMPVSRLYEKSRIDTTGLMPQENYMKIIKRINNTNCNNPNPSNDALWMKLEDTFNSVAKKLFLLKRGTIISS